MKKLNYILFALCLALYGCGMTDVWKDLENQGVMSPDRLRPSEVKALLCASDGWKMTYQGVDFYFQFGEGGDLISDTDASILESKKETDYYLDYKGEKAVLLTFSGGSALDYLSDGRESTLVITAYSAQGMTATGQNAGMSMNLVPVTAADIAQNEAEKTAAIAEKEAAEAVEQNSNGVIRDASGKFLAHYTVSEDQTQITFSVLANRILTHETKSLTVTMTETGFELGFGAVPLNGVSVSRLMYDFSSRKMTTGTQLAAETNRDAVSYYTGSDYVTHSVSKRNSKGDAKEELWQELGWNSLGDLEINNRSQRPLVLCPSWVDSFYYTFFDTNWSVDSNEIDRIYFRRTAGYMGLGGDEVCVSQAEENLPIVLDAMFHADGWYMVRETGSDASYLYLISPTTDNWFKAQQ